MVRTSFNRETRKAYLSKIMSQLATTIHRTSCYHLLHALWANENRQYSDQRSIVVSYRTSHQHIYNFCLLYSM